MTDRSLLAAAVLAAGIAIGGGLVGWGFARGRSTDRYVEVKGLAEREVTADLALWPLRFVAAATISPQRRRRLPAATSKCLRSSSAMASTQSATHLQNLQVSDAATNQYQREGAGPRFVIDQTIIVRMNKPEVVRDASQRVGELIAAGVVLSQGGEYGSSGPTYVFTA